NGFYTIDLDGVSDTKALVDQIKLKEIFINNSKSSVGSSAQNERMNLAHNENTILLKFSTNAHPYPNKLKYQYRLNPNENWSLPASSPELFLPFLPPNDYAIAVKVLDES